MKDGQHWKRSQAVPIPAGIIPEQEQGSGHRAASTLPMKACIISYVRQCWAKAEQASASPMPCTNSILRPKIRGSKPLEVLTLCPAAFPWRDATGCCHVVPTVTQGCLFSTPGPFCPSCAIVFESNQTKRDISGFWGRGGRMWPGLLPD